MKDLLGSGRFAEARLGLAVTVGLCALGVLAATFEVTNTDDSGAGSLRAAVAAANAASGADTITFNIAGGGPHTIALLSPLPLITGAAVTIDGTTQPGFAGAPLIELNGAAAGVAADGLGIYAVGSVVRGLVINRFDGNGISLGTSCLIQGNYLGTDVTGATNLGNGDNGVYITGRDNLIGGPGAGQGNLISGNLGNGVRISSENANGNAVQGNYIGTNVTGTAAVGNGADGVATVHAPSNTIGGAGNGEGNVISGNIGYGINLSGEVSTENVVLNNLIGTTASGTAALGNGAGGIQINEGSMSYIGFLPGVRSADLGGANVISGNLGHGIHILGSGAVDNLVANNFIGLDISGTVSLGNADAGVFIEGGAAYNAIGDELSTGNIISGNGGDGIAISGEFCTDNIIQSNFIGTDISGNLARGNAGAGVLLVDAAYTLIGAFGAIARDTFLANNVISGNQSEGIVILGNAATENIISRNVIGLTADGGSMLGNGDDGIFIGAGADTNHIGEILTGGNIIAGNNGDGIEIRSNGNDVIGNLIGTGPLGTEHFGNSRMGITILLGAENNTVGGTSMQARNVISDNGDKGVDIYQAGDNGNTVKGNYIGTDASGMLPLGNHGSGVQISGCINTRLGGTSPGEGNVIAASGAHGVFMLAGAGSALIQGNLIGVAADGMTPLGNFYDGVEIIEGGSENIIGASSPGAQGGNVIAFNGGGGVVIDGGVRNQIFSNDISANDDLGIDLGSDGVDVNDVGDVDTGSNDYQNYPMLSGFNPDGNVVSGTLNSVALSDYDLQFFVSRSCDDSGFGEGDKYLQSVSVTTDAGGSADFAVSLSYPITIGDFITATATDSSGNTSEFSRCLAISPPELVDDDDGDGINNGTESTFGSAVDDNKSLPRIVAMLGQADAQGVSLANAVLSAGGDNDTNPYGFENPSGLAVDVVGHRLFVGDHENHRVLVFQLSVDNAIASRQAINVIGQLDFDRDDLDQGGPPTASSLANPTAVAYFDDGGNEWLLVASDHNRVLIYDAGAIQNGMDATIVLGQYQFDADQANQGLGTPDCSSNEINGSMLAYPWGVYVASIGTRTIVFVADLGNSRVLGWDVTDGGIGGLSNGQAADYVLGQPNFQTRGEHSCGSPGADTLGGGVGLASWGNVLFVGDDRGHRVLAYDLGTDAANLREITMGMSASFVLGQADFDVVAPNRDGAVGANTLQHTGHLGVMDDYLFVVDGNSRTLVFDLASGLSDGMAAVLVHGQANLTSANAAVARNGQLDPWGLAVAPGEALFVADWGGNRVVSYGLSDLANDVSNSNHGPDATDLLGQTDWRPGMSAGTETGLFDTNGSDDLGAVGFHSPADVAYGVVIGVPYLFVADADNARVLAFAASASYVPLDLQADFVLGQSDFDHPDPVTSSQRLRSAAGLAFDGVTSFLYVSDRKSHRILVFDLSSGISNGMPATRVLGQLDFTADAANRGAAGPQAGSLQQPGRLAIGVSGSVRYLFAADSGNGRVLMFNVGNGINNGENAAHVLGQPDFTTFSEPNSDSVLRGVSGLDFDGALNLLAVADSDANRVVVFDLTSLSDGMAATGLIGQRDFAMSSHATSAVGLSFPEDVAFDADRGLLWVADSENNRTVAFNVSDALTVNPVAVAVLGQATASSRQLYLGDTRTAYTMDYPGGLAVLPGGRLVIAEGGDDRVLIIDDAIGDIAPPEITCPLDADVECGQSVDPAATGMPTASDSCEGTPALSFSDEQSPKNACELTVMRTWTAADECGAMSTCQQVINVTDTLAPALGCPPATTVNCGETDTGTPTVSDDCDTEPSITFSDAIIDACGTFERTWTATDACGNSDSCVQTVAIGDEAAPAITCPADTTISCGASPGEVAAATDDCDGAPTVGFSDLTVNACGDIERTWTATDACGNSDSCVQRLTIADATAPMITCPADEQISCDAAPSGVPATASDDCDTSPVITFADDVGNAGACGGTIARVWTATDACGNAASCTQTITTTDTDPPSISCPSDRVVDCESRASGAPIVEDNCDQSPTVEFSDLELGGCNGFERTWTATDACGNSASCVQTVGITDTSAPSITCPAATSIVCGTTAAGTPTVTDNCDGAPATSFSDAPVDGCNISRTWTATDACGNASSCTQALTVNDGTPPAMTCPPDEMVACDAEPGMAVATATDDCDSMPQVTATDEVLGDDCLSTLVRTWTATDACGNEASCTQTISSADTTPPVVTCPADGTLVCGGSGFGSATVEDDCDPEPTIAFSDEIRNACGDVTRTWTATDACGNQASCAQQLTLDDSVPPVITCPDDVGHGCDGSGDSGTATAVDNCDLSPDVTFVDGSGSGACAPLPRTWTATDACGNTASCVQLIAVPDTTAPVITCPASATIACPSGGAPIVGTATAQDCDSSVTIDFTDNTSSLSNCSGFVLRTWSAVDSCGNSAQCTQRLSISTDGGFVFNFDALTQWPADGAAGVRIDAELEVSVAQAPTPMQQIPAVSGTVVGPRYSFFIGEHTVSVEDYLVAMNDLHRRRPAGLLFQSNGNMAYRATATSAIIPLFYVAENNSVVDVIDGREVELFSNGIGYAAGNDPAYTHGSARGQHPILGVTWFGAVAYCNWLSSQKGLPQEMYAYKVGATADSWRPANLTVAQWQDGFSDAERTQWLAQYPHGYRLPMENHVAVANLFNEFGRAAAGPSLGTVGTVGGGNFWNSLDTFDNGTVPDDYFPPNGFGLDNMSGNVWEWQTDSFARANLAQRSIRGGSWYNSVALMPVRSRFGATPSLGYSDVGFRVVVKNDFLFEVELAETPQFNDGTVQRVTDVAGRRWSPELQPSTTYYWRVRARHPGLAEAPGAWSGALGSSAGFSVFQTSSQNRLEPLLLDLDGDWNLLSVNLEPEEARPKRLFGISSVSWGWNRNQQIYELLEEIRPFEGFWLYVPAPQLSFEVDGFEASQTILPIVGGWNLLGPLFDETPLPAFRLGTVQRFADGGYVAVSRLNIGFGHWIYSESATTFDVDTRK